ncbi:MAG: LysE family translocator [Candidatus Thiodiazotropha endolucinida]
MLENLLALFVTAVVLALVPGPDNLFVLTHSALHGRMTGWYATLGFSTGLIVHTAAVSLGVAALFQTSEVAFNLLKLIGAAYLFYLAWRFIQRSNSRLPLQDQPVLTPWLIYRRGIVMNVTNPKVSLFFLALLPQFILPDAGPVVLQMISFGIVFIVATLLVFGAIAELAGVISPWLKQSDSAQRIMHRVAAVIFCILAMKLLLAEQF